MATRYTQPQAGPLVPSREWAPRFLIVPAGAGLADATLPGAASTMIGGASVLPNQSGLALDLSGSSAYATLPASDNYNILGALTLVWYGVIKDASDYNFLLASASGSGASNNPFELRTDPGGAVTITRSNASYYTQSAIGVAPVGAAVCIVVTHGGDLSVTDGAFYIDGVKYSSSTGAPGYSGPANANTNPLTLGTRGDLYSYAKTQTLLAAGFDRVFTADQAAALSANPWQLFQAPRRVFRVSGGGTPATVTPAGVQSAASVGTPVATGSAVAKPSGVQAASATGTPMAKGAALASPAGVQAASAVGTPTASAGTAIPATAYPVGFQISSAVGLPLATGAALAITGGVSAAASVGTPIAFGGTQIPATVTPVGVSALAYTGAVTANGAAVALPGGVQVIGNVGALIATGEAWCYPIGVQAAVYVGAPTAYIGFIEVPGAMAGRRANVNSTRPLRIQTSSRPAR